MWKRWLSWGGIAFTILFIAFNPSEAAIAVRGIANGLMTVARGFGDFFTALVQDS